jgi:hypothetical protein
LDQQEGQGAHRLDQNTFINVVHVERSFTEKLRIQQLDLTKARAVDLHAMGMVFMLE